MKSERSKSSLPTPKKSTRPTTAYSSKNQCKKTSFEANQPNLTTPRASSKRPQTASNLAVKKWRNTHFHASAPASRREVELLGEWLNSVLADNLDSNDNPLDIVTNAQHWYSVAFNELVRQASVTCAERGRLFACIWKRNQDLFSKIIEVQREEREYILECHKERVQFLKTDLDFCNSRLETIEESYNEELERWKESRERDITKFDSLQQKIDQQIADRKVLQDEIRSLQQQLGIEVKNESRDDGENVESAYSFDEITLSSRLQKLKMRIRNNEKIEYLEIQSATDDITHHIENYKKDSLKIREKFACIFQILPQDAKPNIRSLQWMNCAITYVYATYIQALYQNDMDEMIHTNFALFIYNTMLHIFGNRLQTETVIYDMFMTGKQLLDEGNVRVTLFMRFCGYMDPLNSHVLHYYLFCLITISKIGLGPLYPEVESNEQMIGGIPLAVSSQASTQILTRFTSGRMLKFYTERIEKVANSGFLRFGGRSIAELDTVLEYLLSAYIEEGHKIEDSITEQFKKLNIPKVSTLGEFYIITTFLSSKPSSRVISHMMNKLIKEENGFPIDISAIIAEFNKNALTVPFKLTQEDFNYESGSDDHVPFVNLEFAFIQPQYDTLLQKLNEKGNDIQIKQLKSAKVKFDQNLTGRASIKIFENNIREFFEKMHLLQVLTN